MLLNLFSVREQPKQAKNVIKPLIKKLDKTQLFGSNKMPKNLLTNNLGVNPRTNLNLHKINQKHLEQVEKNLETRLTGIDLNLLIHANIKFYKDLNCIKGGRHLLSLPVRGQRTKTNAKTAKRKKK